MKNWFRSFPVSSDDEPRRPLISIVVPVYNEQENLERCYTATKAVLDALADRYDYEFVFTDNCSTDGTFSLLRALASLDPRIRVYRFSRNFGYQKSILTGYLLARGDVAVQLDADLQDPPSLLPQFLEQWEAGYQVVYGVRRTRRESFGISLARKAFYRLLDVLSEDPMPHDAGDFRLIDRAVIEELRNMYDYYPFIRGTIASLGFRQIGIPYDRDARVAGESKFPLRHLVRLATDALLNHSVIPLRLATYTGLVTATISLLLGVGYMGAKLFFGVDWPNGFATTTVLILFSLGLTSLFLGIIGEYLGRLYQQSKQRPLTIITHRLGEPLPERAATLRGPHFARHRASPSSWVSERRA